MYAIGRIMTEINCYIGVNQPHRNHSSRVMHRGVGVHCLSYCSIQRGNDMNENTNERLTESNISTQEFLAKVEEAAREGAKQGSKGARGGIRPLETVKTIILIAMIVGIGWMVYRFNNFTGSLKDIVSRDIPVEERDLTLNNHGMVQSQARY